MNVVEEVKERTDIVEIVSQSVKLRKSGKNYTGFCPFHPNKRTPAFAVFPDSGTWRCFGACNEGGDVFSFLMKKEGWDFRETLRYLADRAGIELQPLTPAQEAAEEGYDRLREVLEAAAPYYRHQLLQTPEGAEVLSYLQDRGMSTATIETFELGYAPDAWEALKGFLLEKGFNEKELIDAGVVTERESGGTYDRFRGRLMIPIRDVRGRMAGFGGRVMDPDAFPKYINSPQTALFDKGRMLYGLGRARKSIRQSGQVVIVEGYMDVIGLHQAGFQNAVSTMGTAITEHQLRAVKRYGRQIVLALDADAAGGRATLRGLTVARETLDREADPVFDSRGLIRHEGRMDADIRIVSLPVDVDPDELVAEDPDAWTELLAGARTVVDYVLDVLTSERDVEDPKVKGEIARQVLPLIEDVADPVEREAYRQKLARRLMVDERALLEYRQVTPRATPASQMMPAAEVEALYQETAMERFCLGTLLSYPEALYRIDRELQALEQDRLSVKDFNGSDLRVIFQAVRSALNQDEEEPVDYWRNSLDETLLTTAEKLLGEAAEMDLNQPKVLGEVLANFLRLRKRNLESQLSQLRFRIEAVQGMEIDQDQELQSQLWDHTREVQQLASKKERLDRALAQPSGLRSGVPPGEW